ncbi:MAG TPA: hypothetical protein VF973_06010 [Myxococcales bacterium]
MRGTILFGVALGLAVGLAAPRGARACGTGRGGGVSSGLEALAAAAIVVGTTDIVLTLFDGGSAVASHHPSAGYGLFETVFAAPQLALGIAGLTQSNSRATGFFAVYTAWMALLTTHGIWTMTTAPAATTAAVEPLEPRAALQRSEPEPRLQVAIGPTYVPVGQLAQPGFGLVGRF